MTYAPAQPLLLEEMIRAQAYGLGFDLVGITALGPVEASAAFDEWIANGYAGDMEYLERGAEKRRDTRLLFPGAKSAIVVGLDYGGREPSGPVARYARGDDYHDIMAGRLRELHRWIELELGYNVAGRAYVDTAPILERDLAQRAGLGWFGKNTNLINPHLGSFFFIGSLFIALDLRPDTPFEADRCGSCTKCLDACPTDALVEPRLLDATRCISYLTIEQKGPIPAELRALLGGLLYGCDICQEVCPWNVRFARELKEERFVPRAILANKDARNLALEILEMGDDAYRESFRGSPMKRAKLSGLARNARAVLENITSSESTIAS